MTGHPDPARARRIGESQAARAACRRASASAASRSSIVSLPKGTAERAMPVYRDAIGEDAVGRRHRRPVVRRPGGIAPRGREPAGGARPLRLSAPRAGSPRGLGRSARRTGRGSDARSCCSRASRIRSRGSTSCARPSAAFRTRRLVTYPGVGHGVGPVLDEALDAAAAFLERIPDRSCRQFARILGSRCARRGSSSCSCSSRRAAARRPPCWRRARGQRAHDPPRRRRAQRGRASRSTPSAARTAGSSSSTATGPG